MRIVAVKFLGSEKKYYYKTNLNLIKDAIYDIVADGTTKYTAFVKVHDLNVQKCLVKNIPLRTITSADIISAPEKRENPIQKVVFNEEKRITVVLWKSGGKTVLKCAEGDEFDHEKAIALAFMKHYFDDRSYYNDYLCEMVQKN